MSALYKTYEARVQGSIQKQVACENCEAEFAYVLTRDALGSATSALHADNAGAQERALSMANASLKRLLDREHDPVACPGCGAYQAFMIPLLRKTHHRWMVVAGAFFLIIAANLGVLWGSCRFSRDAEVVANATQYGNSALWVGNIGLGIILLRKALALRVTPNSGDPAERIQTTRAVLVSSSGDAADRRTAT